MTPRDSVLAVGTTRPQCLRSEDDLNSRALGDRAGRAAPDAGQAAISEAPATAKLFAILLAGEHAAFTRLMIESQLRARPCRPDFARQDDRRRGGPLLDS